MVDVTIRPGTYNDIKAIAKFAKSSFRETFFESCGYKEEEFVVFIEEEYSDSVIANWIENKDKFGLIVAVRPSSELDDIVCVGFGLVQGQCKLPYEGVDLEKDAEISKLYIAKEYLGRRISHTIINELFKWVRNSSICTGDIYIGVWSLNHRAQSFYYKFGAFKVGEYKYPVGETLDDEFILKLPRSSL